MFIAFLTSACFSVACSHPTHCNCIIIGRGHSSWSRSTEPFSLLGSHWSVAVTRQWLICTFWSECLIHHAGHLSTYQPYHVRIRGFSATNFLTKYPSIVPNATQTTFFSTSWNTNSPVCDTENEIIRKSSRTQKKNVAYFNGGVIIFLFPTVYDCELELWTNRQTHGEVFRTCVAGKSHVIRK